MSETNAKESYVEPADEVPLTPLYGPTGDVLAEVAVPPFPIEHSATACPCGGIGSTWPSDATHRSVQS